MPTLVFKGADGSEQKAELAAELSVGREAGNDVVLAGSNGVSRKHCRFYVEGSQIFVEDFGSANGTLVNGKKIAKPTAVPEGGEVTIGDAVASVVAKRAATGVAKKPGAAGATGQPRSTRMVAATEMPAPGAKPRAGGARAAPSDRPRLTGTTGPWAGQVVDINKAKIVVGRTAPAELTLEDDSVSRRHAEVFKIGSNVSVRDLGSANGTFVNGERITEAPLSPGDVVRFGVIEWNYTGPGAARAAPSAKSPKKLLIAVGAVLVLGVGGLVAKELNGPAEDPGRKTGFVKDVAPTGPQDPLKLLGQCKGYADPDSEQLNWKKAQEVCAQVIQPDPTLAEARPLEKLARQELSYEKLYADAKIKMQTVQEEQALQLLLQIPSNSTVFVKARKLFLEDAEIIEKHADTNCRTSIKAASWTDAFDACRRKLEMMCNTREPTKDDRTRFNIACTSAGRRASEFTCPPEYRRFFNVGGDVKSDDIDPEVALSTMYPDADVRKQVLSYVRDGRPKDVSRQLKLMRQKNHAKYKGTLDDIIQQLDLIDGRYTTGQGSLVRNNPTEASVIWADAFAADKAILPPGIRSAVTKEMSRSLSETFYKAGKEELNKQRYREAFAQFVQAYKINKTNTDVLMIVRNMERQASESLKGGCEDIRLAIDITLPDSAVHKKAEEARTANGCP